MEDLIVELLAFCIEEKAAITSLRLVIDEVFMLA
jgi:hypothetical protein